MSGHSKWSTIKRKKGITDGARAKVFTKMAREIAIAVREGGSADPSANSKLKDVIAKAKEANLPNENIDRAIRKAAGADDKVHYESIIYEGYGPAGVAFMVEALTDNRNRTAGDLRHFFDKSGGNLGQSGCVSYLFTPKGIIVIDRSTADEASLMEDSIEAGAADFNVEDEVYEITTETADLSAVRQALSAKGYHYLSAEVEYIPSTYISVEDEDACQKLEKLNELLDDNEDVSNVWHNMQED